MTASTTNTTVKKSAKYVDIDCEITGEDLNRMIYYFDSGMCDIASKNAAALALRRHLNGEHTVRVSRDGRFGPCKCKIDGKDYKISSGLEPFFDGVAQGRFKKGHKFRVSVPRDLVSEK